jgi:hypothetical protein
MRCCMHRRHRRLGRGQGTPSDGGEGFVDVEGLGGEVGGSGQGADALDNGALQVGAGAGGVGEEVDAAVEGLGGVGDPDFPHQAGELGDRVGAVPGGFLGGGAGGVGVAEGEVQQLSHGG